MSPVLSSDSENKGIFIENFSAIEDIINQYTNKRDSFSDRIRNLPLEICDSDTKINIQKLKIIRNKACHRTDYIVYHKTVTKSHDILNSMKSNIHSLKSKQNYSAEEDTFIGHIKRLFK